MSKDVLFDVLRKMAIAVKDHGVIYTMSHTDKYGNTYYSDGRMSYTDKHGNISFSDGSTGYRDKHGNTYYSGMTGVPNSGENK